MTDFPTLSKGDPRTDVTHTHFNHLFRSTEAFDEFKRSYAPLLERNAVKHKDYFQAKITGNADLSANRWKYAWEEVRLTTDAWDTFTGARAGSTGLDYALNMCEASNDDVGIEAPGTDVGGPDYPAGFDMMAIQGDPVVPMHAFRDSTGAVRYAFSLSNDHDGTCT